MALAKMKSKGESSVVDLMPSRSSSGSERIAMGLNPELIGSIMDRLTDLYNDPIQATVREVISNALDATVAARNLGMNPRPVKITSPNRLNPYFIVEDNGVGMSRDIIKDVVAKYGGSTKSDDFCQIGAYGLGFKAPLAYTDEFYFTSTRDGMTSEVAITRFDEGPETNILHVTETGNDSGTIVKIPVKNIDSDFASFTQNIRSYERYAFTMDEKIVVDGMDSSDNSDFFEFEKIVIEGEDGIEGRVWLNKQNVDFILGKIIQGKERYGFDLRIDYVLSGCFYVDPTEMRNDANDSDIIVELKPGVVLFSSSRDQIMKDERFNAFRRSVKRQILNSEYFVRNLVHYFSSIDSNEEAYSRFKTLSFFTEIDSDEETVIFDISARLDGATVSSSVSVAVEDLTTVNGYNPFSENMKYENEGIFLSSMEVNQGDSKIRLFDVLRDGREKTSKTYRVKESLKISQVNEYISEMMDASSVNILKAVKDIAGSPVFRSTSQVIIVENVDSYEKIVTVMRNRNNTGFGYFQFIVVKDAMSDELKKIVEMRIRATASKDVSFYNFDDFVELTKKNKQKRTVAEIQYSGFLMDALNSGDDVRKIFSYDYRNKVILNIDELVSQDAIFVPYDKFIYQSAAVNVINGMLYAEGDAVFGRPIALVNSPDKAFFEKVSKSSSYAVEERYKPRSALAKRLLEGRVFNRDVRLDDIASVPDEYRVAVYWVYSLFHMAPSDYIKRTESNVNDSPFKSVIDEMSSIAAFSASKENFEILIQDLTNAMEMDYTEYVSKVNSSNGILEGFSESFVKSLKNKVAVVNSLGQNASYYGAPSLQNELALIMRAFRATEAAFVKKALAVRVNEIIGELIQD